MSTTSQNGLVLQHLKKGLPITSTDAFRLYGITRLAARIYDLRFKAGISEIRSETVRIKDRSFKRYFMA